jgi:putative oxidoreductase
MQRLLGRYSEWLYAIMRIIVGLLFMCHGVAKLFGVLGMQAPVTAPKMLAAGVIETVGGGLVALGLLASYAAIIASGEMCVAYFTMHAPRGFWPIVNKGELAVFYCFVFLYVASKGSGRLSLDRLLSRRKRPA